MKDLDKSLDLTLLNLSGLNQALDLSGPDTLNLISDLEAVKLASKGGNLISIDLGDNEVDIVEGVVDSGSGLVAEVLGILDGSLEHTLVLLDSVLGSLLSLLALLTISLSGLLSSLSLLSGLRGSSGLLLSSLLLCGLTLVLLLVLLSRSRVAELLDTLIKRTSIIDQLAQALVILNLLLLARIVVLPLHVALLVTVLIVIRHVLVLVLEGSPRVKVVPEVVEVLDLLPGAVLIAQLWDWLGLAEASLGLEDWRIELVEVALLDRLLGWWLDVGGWVDGVELAALDWVGQDLGRLLDTLEEGVVLGGAGGGLLVWVVAEDLLAVGALDLLLSGSVAVLGETEDGVVILLLYSCQYISRN